MLNVQEKRPSVLNNPPSEDTMKEMAKFFMKTSIPRIIAERKLEGVKENK